LLPLFTLGAEVPVSEVLLAGLEAVEESGPRVVPVVGSEVAAGAGAEGVWEPDWATAGMVRQKLSNHAVEAVIARAFMGNSSPERFLT